jgi:hypothetical protein
MFIFQLASSGVGFTLLQGRDLPGEGRVGLRQRQVTPTGAIHSATGSGLHDGSLTRTYEEHRMRSPQAALLELRGNRKSLPICLLPPVFRKLNRGISTAWS